MVPNAVLMCKLLPEALSTLMKVEYIPKESEGLAILHTSKALQLAEYVTELSNCTRVSLGVKLTPLFQSELYTRANHIVTKTPSCVPS